MTTERTLIIIKPDAVNRTLVGEIIKRFEQKGLKIAAMKLEYLKTEKLQEHYAHHKDKPFFPELVNFMSSIPSVLVVFEGSQAVKVGRKMAGATHGVEADIGTIRGDYSLSNQNNIIHASESVEAATDEILRFFNKDEIHEYDRMDFESLYSLGERKK